MGLNLDDEWFGLIPFDDKGIVELREPDPFESNIATPPRTARTFPVDCGDCAITMLLTSLSNWASAIVW